MLPDIIKTLRSEGRKKVTAPQIRRDYLQERYVLIAPRRNKRPQPIAVEKIEAHATCPFCPERIHASEILAKYGNGAKWNAAVLKNVFPAFSNKGTSARGAYGRQELVVESPAHTAEFQDLPAKQIAELFKVYGDRTAAMKKDPRINYVLCFKNFGYAAGATVSHSHSQIIGSEFVPPHLVDKKECEHSYQGKFGSCPYCDIMEEELRGPRLIYRDDLVAAFAPYASSHAYQAMIMPRRHLDNVADLNARERLAIGSLLKKMITAVKKVSPSYNFYFHEYVLDRDQHLYIKITPRLALWGPVEIATQLIINSVPPEDAAKYYRGELADKA